MIRPVLLTLAIVVALSGVLPAQAPPGAAAAAQRVGTVDVITVHGRSLEGNLAGDSADRTVSVYLPPSYRTSRNRRYPVIYLLHGFTDSDERWFGRVPHFINVPQRLDAAIAAGAGEAIVVMPNAFTKFGGSMYSVSPVTGDWETFIARELVAHIDRNYRTLATATSRGLAGHSMGGYGVLRIGMKYPEVFSTLYAMSPCCMLPNMNPDAPGPQAAPPARGAGRGDAPGQAGAREGRAGGQGRGGGADGGVTAEQVRSLDEVNSTGFGVRAQLASAAAWSPNPKNPPLYVDLLTRGGKSDPLVLAKWAANAPLAMADQYMPNLRKLKALAIDAGDADQPIASTVESLNRLFVANGLAHSFEIYQGDHVNRVAERLEKNVMPFFSRHLATR